MNPNYGYQLYQAQHVTTRTQMIADDAHRGRQAAVISRICRGIVGPAANAITGLLARTPRLQLNED